MSTNPKTHCSVHGALPLWYLGLCPKRDSSIWTVTFEPPRTMGVFISLVEHTSLNHWYIWHAVVSVTSASSAASVTGYCLAHQYMRMAHFCELSLDLLKNEPSRKEIRLLQRLHFQWNLSLMSSRGSSVIIASVCAVVHCGHSF